LVVFLRLLGNAAVLRWIAQGQRVFAGEGGNRREAKSRLVHVQAHGEASILRRFPREVGMSVPRPVLCALFFAGVLLSLAQAQDAATDTFPDRTGAFGGVPFGATLDEAKKSWQLEEVDGASVPGDPVALYLREEESLVLGGLVAREVVYYFLNGKFYAVSFSTPDNRQTTILCEALASGYGAPPHENAAGKSLVWPGQAVSAHLLVNASTGEGRVLLFSNQLQPEYEQSLRDAASKTATQLGTRPGA